MKRTTLYYSNKLSKQCVAFLIYLQRQIQTEPKANKIHINLFVAENQVGIGATDENMWREMLLELSSKPINYLSSGPDPVQQWIYWWQLFGGELIIEPNKILLEFSEEELYVLMAHYSYSSAIFALIDSAFNEPATTNIDVDIATIRKMCNCTDKYASFASFKTKVIDISIRELSGIFGRKIDYSYLRSGKTVEMLRFTIYKEGVNS